MKTLFRLVVKLDSPNMKIPTEESLKILSLIERPNTNVYMTIQAHAEDLHESSTLPEISESETPLRDGTVKE